MSTRYPPPMDLFHEPTATIPALPEHDVEAALLNALRPLSDASSLNLNPTTSGSDGVSPTKSDSSPLRPIHSNGLASVKISPPPQPVFTDSPQKNGKRWTCCDHMRMCARLFQPDARPGAKHAPNTNEPKRSSLAPDKRLPRTFFIFYKGSVGSSTALVRLAYDVERTILL